MVKQEKGVLAPTLISLQTNRDRSLVGRCCISLTMSRLCRPPPVATCASGTLQPATCAPSCRRRLPVSVCLRLIRLFEGWAVGGLEVGRLGRLEVLLWSLWQHFFADCLGAIPNSW